MRPFLRLLVLVGLASFFSGCSTPLIPNTDVLDTPDNREVLKFCETYRKAVEAKNVALLYEMAAPDYYEDAGTLDPTDDLDRAGLLDFLRNKYVHTDSVRYEIRYRRVAKGRQNRLLVDYTYSASFRVPTAKGSEWRRKVSENRLELIPNGDKFSITAGM